LAPLEVYPESPHIKGVIGNLIVSRYDDLMGIVLCQVLDVPEFPAISLLAQVLLVLPLRHIHDGCPAAMSLDLNAEFIPVLLRPKIETGIALWHLLD